MKYILINDEVSNVECITNLTRATFEDVTLVLAQSNGCKIEDTEVTRGIYTQ